MIKGKLNRFISLFLLSLFLFTSGSSFAGNILKDVLKVYKTYQEVNMLLWLSGDIGAEKRLGKELRMWQGLMYQPEKNKDRVETVRRIFDSLVPHFNFRGMKPTITVLRDNTVNAFVIPGGHVYIYNGMLDMVDSEDEIATVLAHELAHAERRHSLKNFRASTAAVALLELAVKNRKDRETWGALLATFGLMKFSREQEREADQIGHYRMAAAGYNPRAQAVLWQKFVDRYGENPKLYQYFSSHPPSKERVYHAQQNLAKMNWSDTAPLTPKSYAKKTSELPDSKKIAPDSLIPNDSFELPDNSGKIPYWRLISGKASITESTSYDKNRSLALWDTQTMTFTRVLSERINVSSSDKLSIEVAFRSETGTETAAVGIEVYDDAGRLRNRVWLMPAQKIGKNWSVLKAEVENAEKDLRVGKTAPYIRVLLQSGPSSSTKKVFFDAVKMIKRK
ncbi:MAG: M48 family metallopeptidase [Candidatus Riflebacteria bacterium]|nr:M48 family metallopeptidase [Candidatus Riflebacteria bacterium]